MKHTQKLVLTGLMTALVFLMTMAVRVPIPFTNGFIHLGDSMIFLSVLIVGPFYGAFASGVGSMLSNILGGFPHYAIPTLIIKSTMALLMGLVIAGKTRKSMFLASSVVFVVWSGFLATLYFVLRNAQTTYGEGIANVVVPGGDASVVEAANRMSDRLPAYLLAAFVGVFLVVSLAAWILARQSSRTVFDFRALVGMVAGGMCMIIGYWLADATVMGYGPLISTFSVPANLLQFTGGTLLAAALSPAVLKAKQIFFKEQPTELKKVA